jgi:hypothetical protein
VNVFTLSKSLEQNVVHKDKICQPNSGAIVQKSLFAKDRSIGGQYRQSSLVAPNEPDSK